MAVVRPGCARASGNRCVAAVWGAKSCNFSPYERLADPLRIEGIWPNMHLLLVPISCWGQITISHGVLEGDVSMSIPKRVEARLKAGLKKFRPIIDEARKAALFDTTPAPLSFPYLGLSPFSFF